MKRFMIVCGGTGGHLAPGISIGQMLQEEGFACRLLVSRREVDSRLRKKYSDLEFIEIPGAPFGWSPRAIFASTSQALMSLIFAFKLIRGWRPHLLIAFGGYLSIGTVLTARLMGIPVALHEANRKPGKAVRFLRRQARRIYLPEGVYLRHVQPDTVRHLGYPVRREMRHTSREQGRRKLGLEVRGKLLVVIGGSLGAMALNEWVRKHQSELAGQGINLFCVSGEGKGSALDQWLPGPDGHPRFIRFIPFCDQMSSLLCAADLVISRAGAGSIAELIRCRTPSILVPFPYATDQHQAANARYLEKNGAGLLIFQEHLGKLLNEVVDLIYNDWLLAQFRCNLGRLDALNRPDLLLRDILALAEEGPGH